jgi:hypothetical protein
MSTYDDKIKTLEVLKEHGSLIVSGYGAALMGYTENFNRNIVAVYDLDRCIDITAEDMPYADAIDYFYFNIHGAYMGENNPIFIRLDKNI